MTECKHGLKTGCSYCHVPQRTVTRPAGQSSGPKRRTRTGSVDDKMNERMAALKRRLREIRGE